MAKNVIIMIGDGMGWEMARAAATANGVPFYTSGQGEGLNFQTLENYTLATTYGTTIADSRGVYSTGNTVYTGNGIDRFILDAGAGSVTIYNFSSNDFITRGSGLTATSALTLSLSGDDTLVSFGADLLATLKPVQLDTVSIV